MTALTYVNPFHRPAGALDLGPLTRGLVIVSGVLMTMFCVIAIMRGLLGLTPDLPHLQNLALVIHVSTVVPCVPLGLFLLLAPKGTPMHKQLGKLWVALMVITATSTIFLYPNFHFTWIHIFVPVTYRAAWLIVSKARKGDIKGHRNEIVGLFLGALMIPGIFAFVLEGRLMNVLLLG